MSDYKLAIKIAGQLDSSLTSAVNQAQNMLNGLNGGRGKGIGQTVFGGLASGAKTLAKSSVASLGMIGAGAIKVAKEATDVGMDFESAMTDLAGTAGITKTSAEFAQLESAARNVGATTNKSATESAEALKYMALAGWSTSDSVMALDDMVKLSSATNKDLAMTSDLVTDSMGALGLGMKDYGGYMDMVARADSAANYSSQEFMEAMIGAGGAARMLGIDVTELGTAAGILANNGTKGSEAGTKLNSIFARMAGQTKPVQEALADLGTTITDDAGNFLSMEEMFGNIKTGLEGIADESERARIMKDLFGTHNLSEAQYLLDSIGEGGSWDSLFDNLENAKNGVDEFGNSFDTLEQRYKTATDNLQGDLDIMKSAAADFGIEIYDAIVGSEGAGLRGAVQEVTEIIGRLKEAFSTEGMSGFATELGNVIGDISSTISTNGGQALKDAQQFASDLIDSLGSETNAAKIGEAGATIIGGLAEGFLTYTGDFGVAAGNIMMNLAKGFNEQDVGAKIGEAAKTMVTKLGDWFQQNKEDLGTTAGNLITGLVEGISKNAGDLLVGGIDIVEGIAEGVVQAGFVLASHAPEIVGDLVNGIIDAIPRFFNAGVALISAVIDGIWSLGEAAGQALYDALTMVDVAPEMEEIFDPGIVDVYAEHVDAVNEKMIELASGTNLTGLQTELLEGQTTLQEVMETMSNMEIDSPEYMEMAQDVQGYIDIMKSAMDELGIEYQQAEQTVEEASSGISESTQAAMDAATEGLTSGAETAATTMQEELNNLRAEAASTGAEVEEALNVDLASTMNADALSTIIESIDAGSIDQLTAAFDTAMTSMTTSANAASTSVMASMLAMTASFAAMAVAVGISNAAVLLSCNLTAAGITSAFASVNLSGIAANMMAGLTQGIIAGGQQALAAARSIASQIAAVMSSALSIHSPSKVTYEIGSYVGAGLENALYDSQPGVESASAALAGSVVGGQTDTLSGTFGAVSSVGSAITGASAAGGESSGGNITYSPQITIAGNASQQDVQNALSWGMGEFEKMYDRLMKDRRRTAFA